jgi:hypothetical protein
MAAPAARPSTHLCETLMASRLLYALVLVASVGCRMCSDSCDYSPPVAGSPHDGLASRAGTVSETTATLAPPPPQAPTAYTAAPTAPPAVTPTPAFP